MENVGYLRIRARRGRGWKWWDWHRVQNPTMTSVCSWEQLEGACRHFGSEFRKLKIAFYSLWRCGLSLLLKRRCRKSGQRLPPFSNIPSGESTCPGYSIVSNAHIYTIKLNQKKIGICWPIKYFKKFIHLYWFSLRLFGRMIGRIKRISENVS